jgi:hypothetical protein
MSAAFDDEDKSILGPFDKETEQRVDDYHDLQRRLKEARAANDEEEIWLLQTEIDKIEPFLTLDTGIRKQMFRDRIKEYARLRDQLSELELSDPIRPQNRHMNHIDAWMWGKQKRDLQGKIDSLQDLIPFSQKQIREFDVETEVKLLKGYIGKVKADVLVDSIGRWLVHGDGVHELWDDKEIYFDAPLGMTEKDVYSIHKAIRTLYPYFEDTQKKKIVLSLDRALSEASKWYRKSESIRRDQSKALPGALRGHELLAALIDADDDFTSTFISTYRRGILDNEDRFYHIILLKDMLELIDERLKTLKDSKDANIQEWVSETYTSMLTEMRERLLLIDSSQSKKRHQPEKGENNLVEKNQEGKPPLKKHAHALLLRFDGDVEAAAQMLARMLVV